MLSVTEIVNSVEGIWTDALLTVNNCILGLIWRTDYLYPFNSHSNDENSNLSSSGASVILKFDTLHSLENYIKPVYYNAYPMTLYFQLQFIKVHCTVNANSAIKYLLKKERLSSNRQRDLNLQKRQYHEDPEKKR